MVWEVVRYWAKDWIRFLFIEPEIYFKFYGFEWISPWPGSGMYVHFFVLGTCGFCLMIGFCYRLNAVLLFLTFTFVFLIDQANYLNHYYLICLVSFLMIFIPAANEYSVDAFFERKTNTGYVPRWALWLIRFQIAIPYFYGGIAKIQPDWLSAVPMHSMLAKYAQVPFFGNFLNSQYTALGFAWGGMLFDIFIVPMLLWRRTRVWAFALTLLFHLTNKLFLNIGVFPWFMIAATTLFLPPEWPRRVIPRRRKLAECKEFSMPRTVGAVLMFYVFLQVVVPLRVHLYPGDTNWTEYGHRFSWRMKLRSKQTDLTIEALSPDGTRVLQLFPGDFHRYLMPHQIQDMTTRPDMLQQFCRFLGDELATRGFEAVEVTAIAQTSLNGRKAQLLVDPNCNLAQEPRTLFPVWWVLPLREPLIRVVRADQK